MKKPWLAALLNIIPFPVGLGYLYLGLPRRFLLAFLGAIAILVTFMAIAAQYYCCVLWVFVVQLFLMSSPLILAGLTAQDAWRHAKAYQAAEK